MIDRFWFKSVYFVSRAVCFLSWRPTARDFTSMKIDESFGESLVLPPWLEADRAAIEAVLPKLEMPSRT